ncbi:hypothetical protein J3R30DRAFT_3682390 [Lentinula aciculospora]|uniref:DUF2786 domain-containing protein n=1 Tax=Lentinula aciculospora TaxID=153920 RepID=A0A9W9DNR0_9AGAR|nr:hypothetical protein J3R30DRAFT_3682390 [Lentinula aciculospora]
MTLERVKKALKMSMHLGTTEHEAHQALRMAMKMMEKLKYDSLWRFFITQAQVLKSMEGVENEEDKLEHTVSVFCKKGSRMKLARWARIASSAIFTMVGSRINSTLFSRVYNLIMEWRMANKVDKGLKGRKKREVEAAEILRLEAQCKREKEQRQKEIERLDAGTKVKVEIEDDEIVSDKHALARSSPCLSVSKKDCGDGGVSDVGDYGDDGNDEDVIEVPDFPVTEEACDIDLDVLQKKSDEHARRRVDNRTQAETPKRGVKLRKRRKTAQLDLKDPVVKRSGVLEEDWFHPQEEEY